MGILLGSPVWYGNRPFEKTIEELYKIGVDYIEFSLDYPLPDCMSPVEKKEMKKLLDDCDLQIGFHSPLDTAIAHPRDEIADANMTILSRCLQFSAEFLPRAVYYNFHVHPRIPTYKLPDVRKQVNSKGLERCKELAMVASEFGIASSVENDLVPFERSDLIIEALYLLYPKLQFTFDVGHAIKAEVCHSRREREDRRYQDYLKRWIEKCGAMILVAHLHDCAWTGNVMQDHVSLGRGEVEFEVVFDILKSSTCKYVLIETFWKNKEKKRMDYKELRSNVELCRSYF